MEFAKVLCMTRDEVDLIEDFIIFYGDMFGYHNVVILENNSKDPHVFEVYKKYEPKGITVIPVSSYSAGTMNHYMQIYKGTCEWLIPLDTDEFICVTETKSTEPNIINAMLAEIPENITQITAKWAMAVIDEKSPDFINYSFPKPARQISRFTYNHEYPTTYKTIFRSSAFQCVSEGNHVGTCAYGETMVSPFSYLHFHFTGLKRQYERAKNLMNGYGYLDVEDNLFAQLMRIMPIGNVYGHHRVAHYREYLKKCFIINKYIEHLNLLPNRQELNELVKTFGSGPWGSDQNAQVCMDTIIDIIKSNPTKNPEKQQICQKDIDDLMYFSVMELEGSASGFTAHVFQKKND